MASNWEEIEDIFAEALLREGSDRLEWLQRVCANKPDTLREVEAMLASHDQPLSIEPQLMSAGRATSFDPPREIGPYRLLEPLGQGGMGSVWLAERADGLLDRKVAVKLGHVPFAEADALALRRRFDAERRILSRLEHPGIVRLLEAGTAGGYPYFAMDYVAGEPITKFVLNHGLSLVERLRLFEQVCEAVHHAHQRLVVHRDLKPSNILVSTEDDGRPRVKLLDFGIARLLQGDGADFDGLTEAGVRLMTRAYAAPEQVRGEPCTTATDVHALGVILYELLTGRRPFNAPSAAELENLILTETPSRLSVDGGRLPGDLNTIVQKALRKEPGERYGSAEAFADDIRRFMQDRPISARPQSAGYQLRSFVRRHRLGSAVSLLALALLVAFTVALAVQRKRVVQERDTARATASFLEGLFGSADPFAGERQDTLRIADLLGRGVERARVELADQPLVRARLLFVIGRAQVQLAAQEPAVGPLTEAIDLSRRHNDRATLGGSLAELGAVRNTQWQLDEAEALAREALEIAVADKDPALRRRAENVLVLTLLNAGRTDEAEALLRSSVDRMRTDPDALPDLMGRREILGRLLVDQGRFDEAEAHLLQLRADYRANFGEDDPRLIGALNPLTFLYLIQGRLEEAERLGREAIEITRDVHPGSSALGETLSAYASVLRRLGRLEEAEAALREALTLPSTRPGARAIPLGGLANVLFERGDFDGAIRSQREAASLVQADSTMERAMAEFSRIKLAGFLRDAGRFEEAEDELLALQAERDRLDSSSTQETSQHAAADLATELTKLYEAWGRPDKADAWRGDAAPAVPESN